MESGKNILEMLSQMQNDMDRMRNMMDAMQNYVKGLSPDKAACESKLDFIEDGIEGLRKVQTDLEVKLSAALNKVSDKEANLYDNNEDIPWMFMIGK